MLAALAPVPRVNLTRFHAVFAPNSACRNQIAPARHSKERPSESGFYEVSRTPSHRRAAMTWAQRLKRVFSIDIAICDRCGGNVKIIGVTEDPAVIRQILKHLDTRAESTAPTPHAPRGLPKAVSQDGS